MDVLSALSLGVQELPRKGSPQCTWRTSLQPVAVTESTACRMRWSRCTAYYIPPGMATKLCREVDDTCTKTLKTPDVWLGAFTKYFLWPPAFGDQGDVNQRLTPACDRWCDRSTDWYCDAEMREWAMQHGRELPQGGCSTEQVLSWQVDDLRKQVMSRRAKARIIKRYQNPS